MTKAVIYYKETPKFDILPSLYGFQTHKDMLGVSIEFEFIYGFLTNISITARRFIELIEYLKLLYLHLPDLVSVYSRYFKVRQNGPTYTVRRVIPPKRKLLLEMQQVRGEHSHVKGVE